jgi:hypothetical protein
MELKTFYYKENVSFLFEEIDIPDKKLIIHNGFGFYKGEMFWIDPLHESSFKKKELGIDDDLKYLSEQIKEIYNGINR